MSARAHLLGRTHSPGAAAALLVAAALLFARGDAHAGDRPLEVVLVNLTPDAASSKASKQCVRAVEEKIGLGDVHVVRVGETAARKQTGAVGVALLDWRAEALARLKPRAGTPADAVVLVDCRPELRRLDVVVSPPSSGVTRIELRAVPVDQAATDLIGDAILRRAWAGFSP